MGKGTDLWDDSALINAFDHAMATYKVGSSEEEKHTSDCKKDEPALPDKTAGLTEVDAESNNITNNATGTHLPCNNNEAIIKDLPVQENNLAADSYVPESHVYSSSFPFNDGNFDTYSDQQSLEYNQLLQKYYELEEQKQKVLQQLQQANYWNSGTSVQSSTCQAQQVPAHGASENSQQLPCSFCSYHCIAVPYIPISACARGGLSTGGYSYCPHWVASCSVSQSQQFPDDRCLVESGVCSSGAKSGMCSTETACTEDPLKQTCHADADVVKIGMMAAERAINSMKMDAVNPNAFEGREGFHNKESSGINELRESEVINSETDLAVVLSAWYSAGFHTGRYLLEQSKKNKGE